MIEDLCYLCKLCVARADHIHNGKHNGKKAAHLGPRISVSGTKLYAVRDSKGRFNDIQAYKRAHSQDLKRRSKAEGAKKKGK